MSQLKVFVSSTCYDLSQIRADLFELLSELGHFPVQSEYHSFPIDPSQKNIENCIDNVRNNTDIFILIVGNRYGSVIESGESITNTEFLYAKKSGIPIYIFIKKKMIELLPVWKDNPEGKYANIVDSNKIFDFINNIYSTGDNWCYGFENVQDIKEIIKIQFSHLFKKSLDKWKGYKKALPNFYEDLSPNAINIIIDRKDFFEPFFFAEVLQDELQKYEPLKLDLKYEIILNSDNRISDILELENWLTNKLYHYELIAKSANNLMNIAFPKFYGEHGQPSDLKGLYYVAQTLARIYNEMLRWHIDIKSTSVLDEIVGLRDNFSKYTLDSAKNIWDFPSMIKNTLNDGIRRIKEGETGDINLKTTLTFNINEEYVTSFREQIEIIKNKLIK